MTFVLIRKGKRCRGRERRRSHGDGGRDRGGTSTSQNARMADSTRSWERPEADPSLCLENRALLSLMSDFWPPPLGENPFVLS